MLYFLINTGLPFEILNKHSTDVRILERKYIYMPLISPNICSKLCKHLTSNLIKDFSNNYLSFEIIFQPLLAIFFA